MIAIEISHHNAAAFTNVAPAARESSIFLRRKVGVVFMRVNSKCAHQVRPPPSDLAGPVNRHGWLVSRNELKHENGSRSRGTVPSSPQRALLDRLGEQDGSS